MSILSEITILSNAMRSLPLSDGDELRVTDWMDDYSETPITEIKEFPHFGLSRSRVRGNMNSGTHEIVGRIISSVKH